MKTSSPWGSSDIPFDSHRQRWRAWDVAYLPIRSSGAVLMSADILNVVEQALSELRNFVEEREWAQFHSPENLAKSIAIESGELLECYQWSPEVDQEDVKSELADVLTYCVLLADRLGADPEQLVRQKLQRTREKYPVDKSRGRSTKYDRL